MADNHNNSEQKSSNEPRDSSNAPTTTTPTTTTPTTTTPSTTTLSTTPEYNTSWLEDASNDDGTGIIGADVDWQEWEPLINVDSLTTYGNIPTAENDLNSESVQLGQWGSGYWTQGFVPGTNPDSDALTARVQYLENLVHQLQRAVSDLNRQNTALFEYNTEVRAWSYEIRAAVEALSRRVAELNDAYATARME
ncbi:hypothetical protein ACMFMG_002691 [Clarireedia jacksonii]